LKKDYTDHNYRDIANEQRYYSKMAVVFSG
jgi:hypothetical protein